MFVDPYSPVQTDYQRQQLNLLRKHRGQPPIPPTPRYIDFIESWVVWSVHICLSMILFLTLIVIWTPDDTPGNSTPGMSGYHTFWAFAAPIALLVTLRSRRAARLRAEYEGMLLRWKHAGCP